MSKMKPDIYVRIKKLRRKYQVNNDQKHDDILTRIYWFSIPTVYTDWSSDIRQIRADYGKYAQRRKRWFNYIRGMMSTFGQLYLVTLTFGDDYDSTNRESRHKYAKTWLKDNCSDYFACMDYGDLNGREHYHCICAIDFEFTEEKYKRGKKIVPVDSDREWTRGFYLIKPIKQDEKNTWKSVSYAFKASVYAFKSAKTDVGIRPFHKRGVKHMQWIEIDSDDELPF